MYPHVQQYAPPPLTQAQRDALIVNEIRRLRSDLTSAFNPYSLQKILDSTLQVMEYMLAGAVIHANPNQVPGRPVDPLDSGKTKVEFFGGPQTPVAPAAPGFGAPAPAFPVAVPVAAPVATPMAPPGAFAPPIYAAPGFAPPPFGQPAQPVPAPSAPVVNGDVQFVRTGPAPQGVEFFGGPGGSQHSGPPQSYERNGQHVEFYPNPPGTPVTGAPAAPAAPVPPSVNTFNNPPTAQIMSGGPPPTVEAGHQIPGYAAPVVQGLPVAPPFANVMPVPHPNAPHTPQSREELIGMLPIPTPNGA